MTQLNSILRMERKEYNLTFEVDFNRLIKSQYEVYNQAISEIERWRFSELELAKVLFYQDKTILKWEEAPPYTIIPYETKAKAILQQMDKILVRENSSPKKGDR